MSLSLIQDRDLNHPNILSKYQFPRLYYVNLNNNYNFIQKLMTAIDNSSINDQTQKDSDFLDSQIPVRNKQQNSHKRCHKLPSQHFMFFVLYRNKKGNKIVVLCLYKSYNQANESSTEKKYAYPSQYFCSSILTPSISSLHLFLLYY